ncbi:ran-binding protein 3-like [Dysidea avara]|uniref:ran-binding protein 3-like n=1 Tax=Dysidea avara TaxID=196820 RepID=UPI00331DA1ED
MTEEKSADTITKEEKDSVKDDAPPTIKRDSTMTKTAEEGRAYVGEETREKTRGMTSSTESSTPTIAGIKRPAESPNSDDETACKDSKLNFKFRPATLQSGPANSKYSNNAQVQSGSSVSSSGFYLKPAILGAPTNSNSSQFKHSAELNSRPILTLGTSSSTGLLSGSDQSSNKPEHSNHDSANDSSKKNIFLQFLPASSSSSQSSTSGFLFGSNLEGRVTGNTEQVNQESDKTDKEDGPSNSNSVVFGGPAPTALPEIERITGEEKEENVLQISSKLYVFDPETHSWKERGRGELHLNDSLQSSPSEIPQSRIVMRCSGTYKVLLNTTIWPNMTCELADKKSLRISAQDTDLTVKVFLIMSNPKHTMSLHKAVMKRITKLSSTLSSTDKQETIKNEEKSSVTSNTESPSTG